MSCDEPSATPARVAPPSEAGASATRARHDRPGCVGPDERRRLREGFGYTLYRERAAHGWSQHVLAVRAEVSETTVRHLEQGHVRPSDAMCTRLARALREGQDALSVAILDVQLRRAAGKSLRPWKRRRPPRVAMQRIYAEAERRIDAAEAERLAAQRERTDAVLAAFEAVWREPVAALSPRSPTDATRWPRVAGAEPGRTPDTLGAAIAAELTARANRPQVDS